MRITKFAIPEIIFGHGSLDHLAPCARRLGASRVLLVSDKGLESSGWVERVMDILGGNGLEWVYFSDCNSNPRDHQVHEGARIYREERADVVIALGGGSPMDTAKGIGTIVGNGGRISDYEGANKIMRPLPPMIFLPTTAGSGSDISQFCIITDVERRLKMSIISRSLIPNVSIIDPQVLLTKSEELIMANLMPAVERRDPQAMEQLSIASTAAGMSFSNAGLGIGHSLAHSLGGMFDVLHGLVHPVLLPHVMRYNLPVSTDRLAAIGRIVVGPRVASAESIARAGIERLEEFFAGFGVPVRLGQLLPDRSALETIARTAVNDACTLTNPRAVTWQDLLAICEEAW
ncbi:MAG TPA: alcohol dehydrogenase [Desulfovibrio sp.]|nr:alcohol dehydrogenase [Desulfovibrio sp.]